jgi:hypothetical protein
MLLLRLSVLALLVSSLCSCGVYQVVTADPNDDEQGMRAAMILMAPPLLITGDWPSTTDKNFKPPSYYTDLIRERHDGAMTNKRADEVLAAMDRLFHDKKIKAMPEVKTEEMFGPPDKRTVRSGSKIDVYQFQSPRGLQERWLVRE